MYVGLSHRRNERKEKERQELSRMDNERYRVLLENMDALFFEWDLTDNTLVCSQGWQERMGYTPVSYTHLDVYKRQQSLCSN